MKSGPNVLVILTDQQRGDAMGAAGWPGLATPGMDRLAAEGVMWRLAFTESPECVPARTTILTGRPPYQHLVTDNRSQLVPGAWTFPRAFREAGYFTWAVGKQHFRPHRADHGFDRLVLGEAQAIDDDDYMAYLNAEGFGWVEEPWGVRSDSYYLPQPSQVPDRVHITTWTGDRTVELLTEAAASQEPFLGMVGFLKPHPPFEPTLPFAPRGGPGDVPRPVDPDGTLAPFPVEDAQRFMKWREQTGVALTQSLRDHYLACIEQVDAQVVRIIDALERLSVRKETIVVFLSDHGELLGDHGLWGKRSFLAGGTRIPLIISAPGRCAAGMVDHAPACQQDLAPTLLAAAGLDVPGDLPGRDLLAPVPADVDRGIVGSLSTGDMALLGHLTTRYRWSYSIAEGRERLFDVDADPDETLNLALAKPRHPAGERARAEVLAAMEASDDALGVLDGHGSFRVGTAEELWRRFRRNRQGRLRHRS